MTSNKIIKGRCCICAFDEDPRMLMEAHHLFGRANSPITMILCKNHHGSITLDQNLLPPSARKKNASDEDKLNFILVTTGSYLEIVGKELKKIGMKKYARPN